jgi:hypothetical protein
MVLHVHDNLGEYNRIVQNDAIVDVTLKDALPCCLIFLYGNLWA